MLTHDPPDMTGVMDLACSTQPI